MKNKEILQKLRSIELCLTAHPDYEKGSEFEDRVFDLQAIQKALILNGVMQQSELLFDFMNMIEKGGMIKFDKAKLVNDFKNNSA